MAEYNIPTHLYGDTYEGLRFEFIINDEPAELDDATVKIEFRKGCKQSAPSLTLTELDGLSVFGEYITINSFIPSLETGIYYYDIQITFPSGRVVTWVEGTWKISRDVTR